MRVNKTHMNRPLLLSQAGREGIVVILSLIRILQIINVVIFQNTQEKIQIQESLLLERKLQVSRNYA